MIKNIKNKKGEIYIYACAIIMTIIIIFAYIFSFVTVTSKIEKGKKIISSSLTSYLGEKSIEIFSILKQGYNSFDELKNYDFVPEAYIYLGINNINNEYELIPNLVISNIHIEQDVSHSISLHFTCDCISYENFFSLSVPIQSKIDIKINYIPIIK